MRKKLCLWQWICEVFIANKGLSKRDDRRADALFTDDMCNSSFSFLWIVDLIDNGVQDFIVDKVC